MEAVEGKDGAAARLDPVDVSRVAAVGHREDADCISAQKEIRLEHLHQAQSSWEG